MTVYVDELTNWGWKLYGREIPSCHLTADTDDELHDFAYRIGLERRWAQSMDHINQYHHHYDLVPSKRKLAVSAGAVEETRRQAGQRLLDESRRIKAEQQAAG